MAFGLNCCELGSFRPVTVGNVARVIALLSLSFCPSGASRHLENLTSLRISVSVISYVPTSIKTKPTPLGVQGKQTGEELRKQGLAN